jgi:hypothetical protein
MKVIYNNVLPPAGFAAITLFGVIFARKKYKPVSRKLINHEEIHKAQAKDFGGWIIFYIVYLYCWVRNLFKYGFTKEAYYKIPFEIEAYANEGDFEYLENR